MSLKALRTEIAAVNDLLCAASLLVWDSRTMMPAGAAEARGLQIATVMGAARDRLIAPATERALEGAAAEVAREPEDGPGRREVEAVREAIAFHRRVPSELIRRKAALRPRAAAAWIEARKRADFSLFAPFLEETLALQRAYADAIGYAEHPYDALIDLYEPGETRASLAVLFDGLRPHLRALREKASCRPMPDDLRERTFPAKVQKRFGALVAERFGYDFARGRLDFTVHPFEISFTRDDVRITMRRSESFAQPAIFGAMHEVGHGLYEQNVDPAFTRTALATDLRQLYAVGGTSFGAHESQSRLWENHVGRGRAFWAVHWPELRRLVQPALDDIGPDQFYAGVTAVRPGPIRTDADELTYDLHIMLRVEIEAALVGGSLRVADLPEAFDAAMERDLGLRPRDDAEGCLQDIHWSSGMFGSFCTYTIGNVMAAQLFEAARASGADVAPSLARGDYAALHAWLKDHVWRHGRRFSRDEILMRATGRKLEPAPYLRHLEERYG